MHNPLSQSINFMMFSGLNPFVLIQYIIPTVKQPILLNFEALCMNMLLS